jgi:hypothetical protein
VEIKHDWCEPNCAIILKLENLGSTLPGKKELETRTLLIARRANMTRENMRTMTIQPNSGIYEWIQKFISEGGEKQDPSIVMNELLALGLWKYPTIVPKANC